MDLGFFEMIDPRRLATSTARDYIVRCSIHVLGDSGNKTALKMEDDVFRELGKSSLLSHTFDSWSSMTVASRANDFFLLPPRYLRESIRQDVLRRRTQRVSPTSLGYSLTLARQNSRRTPHQSRQERPHGRHRRGTSGREPLRR